MGLGSGTPKSLRPQNFKSVAMAMVVTEYPEKLISFRFSWGKYTLKIW